MRTTAFILSHEYCKDRATNCFLNALRRSCDAPYMERCGSHLLIAHPEDLEQVLYGQLTGLSSLRESGYARLATDVVWPKMYACFLFPVVYFRSTFRSTFLCSGFHSHAFDIEDRMQTAEAESEVYGRK